MGWIRLDRQYVTEAEGGSFPADGALGIDGSFTLAAQRMAVFAGTRDSFARAESALRALCGWDLDDDTIRTLTHNVKATIRPSEKDNDKAPDYRVFNAAVEFGAAWKKTSREGRDYLSLKLDDPSFPGPIYASLIEGEGGEQALIWSR